MKKIQLTGWVIIFLASIGCAFCYPLGSELTMVYLLIAISIYGTIGHIIELSSNKESIAKQQTQIDTLTRELEEVKRKLEG